MSLLRADAYRLRRRPEVWILALVIPILAAFGFVSGYFGIPSHYFYDSPTAPPEVVAAIVQERAAYAFPLSILTTLTSALWVALAVFFLVATSLGAEFAWGTIRTALLARSDRGRFLVSRLVILTGLGCALIVALVVLGIGLPVLLQALGETLATPPTIGLGELGLVLAAHLLLVVFTSGVAAVLTIATRNAALAFLVALVYVTVEALVGSNAALHRSDAVAWLPRVFPETSLAALLGQTTDLARGTPPPSPDPNYVVAAFPLWLSFAIVVGWTVLAILGAATLLRRSDIRE